MAHVLLICEYPTLNGGERSMLSTLPHLVAAGHSIHVAAPAAGKLAEELSRQGIHQVPLDLVDADGIRVDQKHARTLIRDIIRKRGPDLVHANSLSMARLLGPVAADDRIASIGHVRDIVRMSRKATDDVNLNTRLIAVSQATREFHAAWGIDADRTKVVYNGVTLDTPSATVASPSIRQQLGIGDQTQLVATIGQVIARKGTDLFVDAAIGLARQRPNTHFLIVGECYSRKAESLEFVANLRNRVAQSPLAGNIHFLGERDDVREMFVEVDVVVQPSRQDPLCRVLLEAAAAACAIVTTNVGGTREIFPDGSNTAIVVASEDRAALTTAIVSLLGDSGRRQAIGANARTRIEEAFTIAQAANALQRHYEEVVELLR